MNKKITTDAEKDAFAQQIMDEMRTHRLTDDLTQLNFGGGQDSTAILLKMIHDADFRKTWAPGRLIVVMSDTGNEHPATYVHVAKMMRLAKRNQIEMFVLSSSVERTAKDMGVTVEEAKDLGVKEGYHSESWATLTHHWQRVREIAGKSFGKSCTDNLKLQPIYRHLEEFISQNYDLPMSPRKSDGKRGAAIAAPAFAKVHGKIRVLIGIARGEEKRVSMTHNKDPKWRKNSSKICYPLLAEKMDRKGCQDQIKALEGQSGVSLCLPSNCVFCPYLSEQELLWLSRRMPDRFEEWVQHEATKIAKHDQVNAERVERGEEPKKNHGVTPGKTLRQSLAQAEKRFGYLTDADLDDYKMSHGHCVASKY